MNNVYLIGFMGVGKSTVGKKLAAKLGYHFIDTDVIFQEKFKLNIDTFFNKYGEELFRKLEYEILKSTINKNKCIISTGGGLPCYLDAMNLINNNGISVYLEMNPEEILSRLKNSKQKRPLIIDKSEKDLINYIKKKIEERNPIYSKATLTIPALSINTDSLIKELSYYM